MHLLTASEAQHMARRAAANLAAVGCGPGQRVAIAVRQTPQLRGNRAVSHVAKIAPETQARTIGLVLGALRSGVIPVMVNPSLPPTEREHVLRDCRPALAIDSPARLARLVEDDSALSHGDLADVPLGRPMHYTSGTTGVAKGVWTGLLSEEDAQALWADELDQWSYGPDDLSLVHGPLAHSGPLRFAMLCLLAGGKILLPGRFDAAGIAKALVDYRPTTAFVAPSHLQRLFALPGGPPPSPYRLLAHAGAACPAPLKRQLHGWAGAANVWEFYGSTEGQFAACSGPEWEQRPGTVGRARRARRLLIDNNAAPGARAPADKSANRPTDSGTIWCEAPPFASFEYFGDPIKTAAAWRDTATGRAFTVGDLGRTDADGYLFLDGRRADLIITGGVNVYPAQVESVLLEHPGVDEIAVFGVDDGQWGQRVCAAVVGTAKPQALLDWARPRLAPYQRPKQIFALEQLPRTASGKIKRNSLAGIIGVATRHRPP